MQIEEGLKIAKLSFISFFLKRCVCVCVSHQYSSTTLQRLAGATLLVFANKQDLPGALSAEDIKQVQGNVDYEYTHAYPTLP